MMAESTTPVPVTPRPQFLATSIKQVMRPVCCRPLAKKAATKIRPTVLVRMLPMPLNMEKDRSKDFLASLLTRRSTRKQTNQERNMAVATFIVMVL